MQKSKKALSVRLISYLAFGGLALFFLEYSSFSHHGFLQQYRWRYRPQTGVQTAAETAFFQKLALAAETRLKAQVKYDGSYHTIAYPMGDVPANMGVCTDVVIRSYRMLGIDLQERVHRDMSAHFWQYPKIWRLSQADSNIDHRRVPNLMTFFNRAGASLAISPQARDYLPGDIVSWDLGRGNSHIGIVSSQKSPQTGQPLIVHNIAVGPELSDMLFDYPIIGHYRYGPAQDQWIDTKS